jgi:hypothetical protein
MAGIRRRSCHVKPHSRSLNLVDARVRRKLIENGLKMTSGNDLDQNSLTPPPKKTKSAKVLVKPQAVQILSPEYIHGILHPHWPPKFAVRVKDATLKLSKGVPRLGVINQHGRIVVEAVEQTEEEMRRWRRDGWKVKD